MGNDKWVAAAALGAPGLNWHVGLDLQTRTYRFGCDHLKALPRTEKESRIAVVCSSANFTLGQWYRLALLDFLKQRLGGRIVHSIHKALRPFPRGLLYRLRQAIAK